MTGLQDPFREVCRELVTSAPEGWRRLLLRYVVQEGVLEFEAACVMADTGACRSFDVLDPLKVHFAFQGIRRVLAERGAPLRPAGVFVLESDGRYAIESAKTDGPLTDA